MALLYVFMPSRGHQFTTVLANGKEIQKPIQPAMLFHGQAGIPRGFESPFLWHAMDTHTHTLHTQALYAPSIVTGRVFSTAASLFTDTH